MSFIQKIIAFFKKVYRVDYLAHFIAGFAGLELLFTICHIAKANIWWYIGATIFMVLIIFAKDVVYDKWWKKGTFEWMDIILGSIGVVLVIIQWLLLLI